MPVAGADPAAPPPTFMISAPSPGALAQALGLDPAALDSEVKARQAAILAANGGREAVLARGDLPYSPPPGAKAAWS
jgi:choline-sulfatase